MSIITLIFYRLASIPLYETMNPMNFSQPTPKAHYAEFNFILYCHSTRKASRKSE